MVDIFIATALLLLVSRCSAAAPSEVTVGILDVFNISANPLGFFTQQIVWGAMLAVERANLNNYSFPLLPDTTVKVHVAPDTESSNRKTVEGITEVLSISDLVGVMGPSTSSATVFAHKVLGEVGVPHFSALATTTELLNTPSYFRTFPDIDPLIRGQLDYLRVERNIYSFGVIVVTTDDFAVTAAQVAAQHAVANGMRVASQVSITGSATDEEVASVMLPLVNSKVRVFLVLCGSSSTPMIFRVADSLDLICDDCLWMYPGPDFLYPLRQSTPSLYNHTRRLMGMSFAPLDLTSPAFSELDSLVKASTPPSFLNVVNPAGGASLYISHGHDSMVALLLGLHNAIEAGEDVLGDPSTINTYLGDTLSFPGATGQVNLTSDGNRVTSISLLQYRDNGAVPTVIASQKEGVWRREGEAFQFDIFNEPQYGPTVTTSNPPTFIPDTCSSTEYRDLTGLCISCPSFMMNPSDDAIDFSETACQFCEVGFQLVGSTCLPCTGDEEAETGPSGEPLCTSTNTFPWLEFIGSSLGTIFVMVMIGLVCHYRSNLQKERQESIARKTATETQNRFVSFVFHELRSPLNGVNSHIEHIQKSIRKAKEISESVATTLQADTAVKANAAATTTIPLGLTHNTPRSNGGSSSLSHSSHLREEDDKSRSQSIPSNGAVNNVSTTSEEENTTPEENNIESALHRSESNQSKPSNHITYSGSGGKVKKAAAMALSRLSHQPSLYDPTRSIPPSMSSCHRTSSFNAQLQDFEAGMFRDTLTLSPAETISHLLDSTLDDLVSSQHCVRHMSTLLDSIMDLGALARGSIDLVKEEVCIDSTTESVLRVLSGIKPSLDLSYTITSNVDEVKGRNVTALTDGQRLQQVLINLVTSSIQATNQGYIRVRISVDHLDPHKSNKIALSANDYDLQEMGMMTVRNQDVKISVDSLERGREERKEKEKRDGTDTHHGSAHTRGGAFPHAPNSPISKHTASAPSRPYGYDDNAASYQTFLPPEGTELPILLSISVEDSGEALSPALLDLIEQYKQTKNFTESTVGGDHLPLQVAMRLVDLMHGQFSVLSSYLGGCGSIYSFSIPTTAIVNHHKKDSNEPIEEEESPSYYRSSTRKEPQIYMNTPSLNHS